MARHQRRKPLNGSRSADRMHALLKSIWSGWRVQNFSADTVTSRRDYIGYFLDWCRERGLEDAHRDHAARPGALSALAVSLPQGQRRSR